MGDLDEIGDSFESVGTGIAAFGEGFIDSFGKDPSGYSYSFGVFNNSSIPITADPRALKSYMGIMTTKGSRGNGPITLAPYTHTIPGAFVDLDLYISVHLSGNGFYFSKDMSDCMEKHDKTVYWYNVYENPAGVHGEYLGSGKTISTTFTGSFYNSLPTSQTVTFPFAGQQFTTVLEPSSSAILQDDSTITNCIRPPLGTTAFFDCGPAGKMPIAPDGLATGNFSNNAWTNVNPMQYHYELYADHTATPKVWSAGLSVGHFVQATNGRVRDITPVRCLIWNKSAAQMNNTNFGIVYLDQPQTTVWVVYSTKGWSNSTQKIQDTVMAKIPAGTALQMYILRPLIDGSVKLFATDVAQTDPVAPDASLTTLLNQTTLGVSVKPIDIFASMATATPTTSKAILYIVSLATTDDAKAKVFLQNLIAGKIALPDLSAAQPTTLTDAVKGSLLAGAQPTNVGQMKDPISGVTGYLLTSDMFLPYGNGGGPFYYSINPACATVSPLYTSLAPYIKPELLSTDDKKNAFLQVLGGWITQGYQGLGQLPAIRSSLQDYLQQNGKSVLFNPGTSTLSLQGTMCVDMALTGPSGVIHCPLLMSTGINYFVYTQGEIPSFTDPKTNKKVVTWKPDSTIGLDGKVVATASA